MEAKEALALELADKMLTHVGCIQKTCDGRGTLNSGDQCQWCDEHKKIKQALESLPDRAEKDLPSEEEIDNFIEGYFVKTEGSPNDIRDAIEEAVKWALSKIEESKGYCMPDGINSKEEHDEYLKAIGVKVKDQEGKKEEKECPVCWKKLDSKGKCVNHYCLSNNGVSEL